jgi:uncharacterized membrane-anchored protein
VGFGFRDSALLLSGIMLALLAAHYFTRINGMVLFWIVFVLTRPLGATGGDPLPSPVNRRTGDSQQHNGELVSQRR